MLRNSSVASLVAIAVLFLVAPVSQAQVLAQFDLPPQPLAASLRAVGSRTSTNVLFDPPLVEGLNAPGVQGEFTAEEAFRKLLIGTGLKYRFLDDKTVMVISATQASASAKPTSNASRVGVTRLAQAQTSRNSQARQQQAKQANGQQDTFFSSSAGNDAETLEEIVVIGLKRLASVGKIDVPLIEAPQSISIISGRQIETMLSQTVTDVLNYAPGVRAGIGFDTRADDFFLIRGLEVSFSGVFRDGLRLPASALNSTWEVNPYGVERIEVMRGPASVLYGQMPPGGVVNLVTKRPTDSPQHEIGVTVGSFERVQGFADLSGPIDDEGRWLYRLTGLARDSETQTNFTRDDEVFVAPALTWQPTPDTYLTLLTSYQMGRTNATLNFLPFQGTVLPNPNGRIPIDTYTGEQDFDTFDKRQIFAGYLFEHQFGDNLSFLQNLRYGEFSLDYELVFGSGWSDGGANLSELARGVYRADETMEAITVDNQIQARWSNEVFQHNILLGADYQYSTSDTKSGFGAGPTINPYDPVYGQPVTIPPFTDLLERAAEQIGIYIQDHIKIREKFIVRLAARHDWAKTEGIEPISGIQLEDLDDKELTGQAGISYLFDNGVAPYVSYSTSFNPIAGEDSSGNPFVPQQGKQIEGGVKFDLRDRNIWAAVALFDLRQQNVPTLDPNNAPFGQVQIGELRSRGAELEITARPIAGLNLLGSYAYTDVETIKSNDPAEIGLSPNYQSDHLVSLWGDYEIQAGAIAGLTYGVGVRYVASVPVTEGPFPGRGPPGPLTVPSYALFDAVLSYDWNSFRFAINATNISDKHYTAACERFNCYNGSRRTILATAKYHW